jgi:trehalose-phosphatase
LSEIAPWPDEAVVTDAVRAGIDSLSRLPSVTFGVVSGRGLDNVRERVGPVAEFVAGVHGLEIEGPGLRYHHEALDGVAPILAGILEQARRDLAWCQGLLLEDKTFAITCHTRMVPPQFVKRALKEFQAIAQPQIDAGVLKTQAGASALELLPNVDWNKGRATQWIRSKVHPPHDEAVAILYLGDDRTDEDAFAALGKGDIAVGVGDRPHANLLDWRLAGPASVGRLLGFLARFRGEGGDRA